MDDIVERARARAKATGSHFTAERIVEYLREDRGT